MMKKVTVKTTSKPIKTTKNSKDFYSFSNYKPNKNAKPVVYNGTTYLSKTQCIALEGITRKELDAYLNRQDTVVEIETLEQAVTRDNFDEHTDELMQDILAEQEVLNTLLDD